MKSEITKATTRREIVIASGLVLCGLCAVVMGVYTDDVVTVINGGLIAMAAVGLLLSLAVLHQTHIAKEEILKGIKE